LLAIEQAEDLPIRTRAKVLARSEIDLGHTKLSTRDCPSGSETKWDMSLAMSPASEPVRAGGVSRADTAPHDLGRVGKDDRMTPDKDVVRADDMSLSRRTPGSKRGVEVDVVDDRLAVYLSLIHI